MSENDPRMPQDNNSKDPINSPIMKDIIKYNEFDCKVFYDIIKYIRNHHS